LPAAEKEKMRNAHTHTKEKIFFKKIQNSCGKKKSAGDEPPKKNII
jgi:hypothetical protein